MESISSKFVSNFKILSPAALNLCNVFLHLAPKMSNKRKYIDSYTTEFKGVIKRSKEDDHFHCIPCNEDISLASSGKKAISQHLTYEKHKKNAKAANISKGIQAFTVNTSAPANIDLQRAAAEGIF